MSRLGAIDTRVPIGTAPIAREGLYPAVGLFAFVFLCTLPLTGVPDEAFAARMSGFVATGWRRGG